MFEIWASLETSFTRKTCTLAKTLVSGPTWCNVFISVDKKYVFLGVTSFNFLNIQCVIDLNPPLQNWCSGYLKHARPGSEIHLAGVVALHEPTTSPSQPRVTSQPRVNHETSHFFKMLSRKKIYLNIKRTYS